MRRDAGRGRREVLVVGRAYEQADDAAPEPRRSADGALGQVWQEVVGLGEQRHLGAQGGDLRVQLVGRPVATRLADVDQLHRPAAELVETRAVPRREPADAPGHGDAVPEPMQNLDQHLTVHETMALQAGRPEQSDGRARTTTTA